MKLNAAVECLMSPEGSIVRLLALLSKRPKWGRRERKTAVPVGPRIRLASFALGGAIGPAEKFSARTMRGGKHVGLTKT